MKSPIRRTSRVSMAAKSTEKFRSRFGCESQQTVPVVFRTVQSLVFQIRLAILEQMNRLSADYHETTPIGEKLYRLEQDVDQVAELGSSLVPYVLQTAFNTT